MHSQSTGEEGARILSVLSQLSVNFNESKTMDKAKIEWCKLIASAASSPCVPEGFHEQLMAKLSSNEDRKLYFTRRWLRLVVECQHHGNTAEAKTNLDAIGAHFWHQNILILEQAITAKASTSTSTSTSSKSEVLPFAQAELLLFVWKTGLLPETQASVLKQLLSLLTKPVEPDSIATACIAMTHVAFLAQTLLRPELVPINELLADVQKNMHFTTESKDDKPKPDDEKTMLPNVVKTMTKTMGCCDMWKLFSVSVEDAPSLEHDDDEGWHQSMF